MNDQIRRNPIRLIDEQEQMAGVVDTGEALDRARELGLDLVEVAPDADPPVCRILDYGKFRYEQSKKERANKKNSKTAELKSIRLGRSLKIGQNDIEIRIRQTQKFLLLGHKVQIVQRFRGREVTLTDKGMERLADIADRLAPLSKVEAPLAATAGSSPWSWPLTRSRLKNGKQKMPSWPRRPKRPQRSKKI